MLSFSLSTHSIEIPPSLTVFTSIHYTLRGQGDTRFCTTDLRFCRVTVAQRTSSTLRSSALQNHKSEAQNSFGPQVPYFGGWQGNGMRRTGRTPIDVNAASRQKTALGASVPLFTEGKQYPDAPRVCQLLRGKVCHYAGPDVYRKCEPCCKGWPHNAGKSGADFKKSNYCHIF